MPRLALVLVVLWFSSLCAFRSAVQWWHTGSTGVKGFSGEVGSIEWSAGVLASLGLALAGLAPLVSLLGWPLGGLLFTDDATHGLGACLCALGIAGALLAQLTMGDSWRVGVDHSERTTLVTHGVYRWVRNPIFSFIGLSMIGLVLLVPSVLSLLAAALTAAGIEIQVRAVEEPYLARVQGAAYRAYCRRTGRFLPGIGMRERRPR